MLLVVAQLGNGFLDIRQGKMLFALLKALELRLPAEGQFLKGADVDIAVVEIALQLGHEAGKKAAVVPDRVAAKG